MASFFVNRPIVAMVISIIIVILGVISLQQLPIAQYPELAPPVIKISANYTGANAINVEQSVATPLEQQINGVENSLYMKSTNGNDGSMTLNISFAVGSDPDMNNVLTQNRVATATPKLPEEVKRTGVTTKKAFSFPLMLIAITSPDNTYDRDFLNNYVQINVLDAIARIPGVGEATLLGAGDYAMRIWIKPDLLARSGITIPEIVNAIRQQNVIAPGGQFGAEPAPPGTEFTYTVRLADRLQTEEEFGNIVVRTNPDGSQVRIRDLARVELGSSLYNAKTRLNGQDAAGLAIYQSPGSNALEIKERILAEMERLSASFPEDMDYTISLDTTSAITAGINEIVVTFFQALALVILVVFIFLQNWRATLIPTLAIPVSLIGAFALFPLLGFSINVLSLLGLVLAIGIVVDDAIVVVEAVQAYIEQGYNPKEATKKAMADVSGPVIATTLVLVAVFAPVALMEGITGALYQQFAITIAVSVVISSVNALTLSPALCSLLLRESKPMRGPLGAFFRGFNKVFDRGTEGYMRYTSILARKFFRTLVFLVVVIGATILLFQAVPGGFIPEEDQGYMMVNVQLPDAASLQRTDAVMEQVEKILDGYGEIQYRTAVSGFSLLTGSLSTNMGFFFITLEDWEKRPERQSNVFNLIRRLNFELYRQIPGAQAFAFGPPAIQGLGSGSGFSIILQDRSGNPPEYLAQNTQRFLQAANQRPEIASAFSTFQANVPQRFIEVDRDKTMKQGIALNDLYTTVGAFLGGSYVNDFNRFGRLYRIFVQAEPEYRYNADGLDFFFVRNQDNEMVPINTLADVRSISGPEYTSRFNLFRAAEVTGQPAPGYSSTQALAALEEVAAEVLPGDMSYAWNAMSYQEKEAAGTGAQVFLLSLLFVFLILAAQYESWSLPMAILLGTPIAVFGAVLGLWVSRQFPLIGESYVNNVFAQIALILLIALAAKNAILIVEFAKMEFDKGLSLTEAAIKAARLRFRPILMTAFSFVLGVIPLLVAVGANAEARKVMGMAVFGGLLIATLVGVFVYPAFFVLIGKLGRYEKGRLTEPVMESGGAPAIDAGDTEAEERPEDNTGEEATPDEPEDDKNES